MPITIRAFEPTPNPDALKCWLDRSLADRPRSYRNRDEAAADPLARRLFEEAGIVNLLIIDDWMTVTRPRKRSWRTIKDRLKHVLADAEPVDLTGRGGPADDAAEGR